MKRDIRKVISSEQLESLFPFNKKADIAGEMMGLSSEDYWFQISIEVTRDCDRFGHAILEAHKRK